MLQQINIATEKEIKNTILLWECYFKNIQNEYSQQFKFMLPDEQNNVIELLTQILLEYKYNPAPENNEDAYEINPYYRFTSNKKPLNLIYLSLKEVF